MSRDEKRAGGGSKASLKKPSKDGSSHRLARVEKEIRDVIGTYLVSGFRGSLPGFASLTRVRISADLKIANLNFTMIMTQNEGESHGEFEKRQTIARREAEKELNLHARDFQAELAHKLQLRFTPKIAFHYDEGFESALKVEQILREMSVKGSAVSGSGSESDSDSGSGSGSGSGDA